MTDQTTSLGERLHGGSFNYAETNTALLSLLGLGVKTIQFGMISWMTAATRIATLQPEPSSKVFALLLGAIPGIMLGAIPPYLVQYRDWLDPLNDSWATGLLGQTILLGTYSLLFVYHPVTGVIFAILYLICRSGIVGVIYIGYRIGIVSKNSSRSRINILGTIRWFHSKTFTVRLIIVAVVFGPLGWASGYLLAVCFDIAHFYQGMAGLLGWCFVLPFYVVYTAITQ